MELRKWQKDFLSCNEPVQLWTVIRQIGTSTATLLKGRRDQNVVVASAFKVQSRNSRSMVERKNEDGLPTRQRFIQHNEMDTIKPTDDILIVEQATLLKREELDNILCLKNGLSQIIFIGVPNISQTDIVNLCIEKHIPIHRVLSAWYHNNGKTMNSFKSTLTPAGFRAEILGLYDEETEAKLLNTE